jgi:hypothetical protein
MIRQGRLLALLIAAPLFLSGQSLCGTTHLTIFDSNLAEFYEGRTINLRSGENPVEWRSLMPQTLVRTIRATVDDHTAVTREDVTYDGPEIHGQKSPVLHLMMQNDDAPGPHKVRIDYLAPGMSWKADYGLLLEQPAAAAAPDRMRFDGWATVENNTGADICAESVDLVAGEVQLLVSGAGMPRSFTANAQNSFLDASATPAAAENTLAEVRGMSVFSRFRLGRNINIAANASINRFALFRSLQLPVEQRFIFENDAAAQTLGRGGFTLAPRGLTVRLVSRNQTKSPLPGGQMTIYSQDEGIAQVVGQDEIPLTPASADFSVTQGRSNLLQATRRVLDRSTVPDPTVLNHFKLVTKIEVVIVNHGPAAAVAFIREGIEGYGRNWTVTESTDPYQKIGDLMIEFHLPVPGEDSVKLIYTVESR